MQIQIKRVEEALEAVRRGKMVILTDHPDRENEGDLIIPAERINDEMMNFMIRNGTGIVCLAMGKSDLQKLNLPLMVAASDNSSPRGTPFTVSIDAREGITTGVSAYDRTETVLKAISSNAKADDFVKPGHIFPLCAKQGGVLERQGHTEGSVDIARLAGYKAAAVICEVMNADGTMACGNDLRVFAEKHQLTMLSIEDLIYYRKRFENLIRDQATISIPLAKYGDFELTVVREKYTTAEHLVFRKLFSNEQPPLVRIHSSCVTGDLFGSERCDCHAQLHFSLQRISQEGGVLIYLNQEGRGIGLFNKIKAYALQASGLDTVEANEQLGFASDLRSYHIAANILRNLNILSVRLLTNNPDKVNDLLEYGLDHVERATMPSFHNSHNQFYLKTKKEKLKHVINFE